MLAKRKQNSMFDWDWSWDWGWDNSPWIQPFVLKSKQSLPLTRALVEDDELKIQLNVPGVKRDAISVSVDKPNDKLLISTDGTKFEYINPKYDFDTVKASLEDGVLTITAEKKAEKKQEKDVRRIEIT